MCRANNYVYKFSNVYENKINLFNDQKHAKNETIFKLYVDIFLKKIMLL